jgi:metallophosphoesterase superfamily enzyme
VDLTIALVTDVHVGPEARFQGKLRKLTAHAPALLERFVERMNREVCPDVVVQLGDVIEHRAREDTPSGAQLARVARRATHEA